MSESCPNSIHIFLVMENVRGYITLIKHKFINLLFPKKTIKTTQIGEMRWLVIK